MKIGVPAEIKLDEYRVAVTPAGVREMSEHGHEVLIEAGAGVGQRDRRRGVRGAGRGDRRRRRCRLRAGRDDPPRQGAAAGGDRDAAPGPAPLHLSAPGAGPRADQWPLRLRRHLHRLRDGRGLRRAAAAAGADERDRRQDRHPGGRLHAGEAAGGARDPARRRPRGRRRQRDGDRRRRGRHERRLHRDRDGGRRLRLRPLDRPPARARRHLRRPLLDRLLDHPRGRGDAAAGRPGDRRRPRPRRPRPLCGAPPAAGADEARLGPRRRRNRPGRLLRDLAADHPPRAHLRGRRDHPLLRRQHARRGPDHLHPRPHQRDVALRDRPRRPRRRRGDPPRPRPAPRRQRRRRQGHAPGGRRGGGDGIRAGRGGAGPRTILETASTGRTQ